MHKSRANFVVVDSDDKDLDDDYEPPSLVNRRRSAKRKILEESEDVRSRTAKATAGEHQRKRVKGSLASAPGVFTQRDRPTWPTHDRCTPAISRQKIQQLENGNDDERQMASFAKHVIDPGVHVMDRSGKQHGRGWVSRRSLYHQFKDHFDKKERDCLKQDSTWRQKGAAEFGLPEVFFRCAVNPKAVLRPGEDIDHLLEEVSPIELQASEAMISTEASSKHPKQRGPVAVQADSVSNTALRDNSELGGPSGEASPTDTDGPKANSSLPPDKALQVHAGHPSSTSSEPTARDPPPNMEVKASDQQRSKTYDQPKSFSGNSNLQSRIEEEETLVPSIHNTTIGDTTDPKNDTLNEVHVPELDIPHVSPLPRATEPVQHTQPTAQNLEEQHAVLDGNHSTAQNDAPMERITHTGLYGFSNFRPRSYNGLVVPQPASTATGAFTSALPYPYGNQQWMNGSLSQSRPEMGQMHQMSQARQASQANRLYQSQQQTRIQQPEKTIHAQQDSPQRREQRRDQEIATVSKQPTNMRFNRPQAMTANLRAETQPYRQQLQRKMELENQQRAQLQQAQKTPAQPSQVQAERQAGAPKQPPTSTTQPAHIRFAKQITEILKDFPSAPTDPNFMPLLHSLVNASPETAHEAFLDLKTHVVANLPRSDTTKPITSTDLVKPIIRFLETYGRVIAKETQDVILRQTNQMARQGRLEILRDYHARLLITVAKGHKH